MEVRGSRKTAHLKLKFFVLNYKICEFHKTYLWSLCFEINGKNLFLFKFFCIVKRCRGRIRGDFFCVISYQLKKGKEIHPT